MCGIVGIFDMRGKREIDRALLERMNQSQVHRGPDEGGLHLAPGIGLGHRRLSIIDLSGGRQPLYNEDHSVVVVYNGEIFNFAELTRELEASGHRFRTHCDTEVIVHAWEEWGDACVERFRGQFAFGLWDENRQTLFLARDRLGIKPLYYAVLGDGTVLFASELKALLKCPDLPRKIDVCAVEDYFAYGYVPDPRTIYRSVVKLAPAHRLVLRRGGAVAEPQAYWDIPFGDGADGLDEDEVGEELIARLRDAVDVRMIADVPLGAFLSGGVDSSSVVAMMAGLSSDPVNTCSISFGDPDYDESRYAAEVAHRYGTRHHVNQVDPDAFDLVDRLASFYDEPFADSSAMPTYRVCKLARERVTVALSGDGGDEVFAGYRRYRWHHLEEQVRSRLPDAVRAPLFGFLGAVYPKADWAPKPLRAKSTLQSVARDSVAGYFHSVSILHDGIRRRLFSSGFRRELQGYHAIEILRRCMANAPSDHHVTQIQYADMKTYLPGDILTKVDRTSMANSLEVRVPILDHPFVEWAATLPPRLKLRGREGKYVLKKALEPHLSHELLYRPKMGFAVPLASWFRGPLRGRVREALTGAILADTDMFDMAYVEKLVDQHQSGLRDHAAALWAVLMFESFLRQVHAGESPVGDARGEPRRARA
ncbi:MAG: XrtA/PEP-CTERM system amidotransferase [Alphaproteobacteria bacterium]